MSKWSEQKIYVYIALIFGVLFVFLTPPFQSPDEDSHFKKTYMVSKGVLYPTVKKQKSGNYIPKEMDEYINHKLEYMGKTEQKYEYSESIIDQYATMNFKKKNFRSYSTDSTLFLAYVPSAIGIICSKVVTKVFGLKSSSIAYMLYFARLFSLFLSIYIVYNAIKIAPLLKRTITAVALMPMSLYLMSMVTYDSLIISVSIFTVSYILKLIYDKKVEAISKKHIALLSILGFILFNYKVVYCTIFILLFFVPKEKFGNMKKKVIDFIIIGFIVLFSTIIFKIPMLLLPEVYDSSRELINAQKSFVMNNIPTYIIILCRNIIGQRTFQLTSMVGMFGLIDTYLPIPVIAFYLLLLLVVSLVDNVNSKYTISTKMKLATIFASILSIVAIYTAMYISWTPQIIGKTGTFDITGVQGRYFIPLLIPILMIFSNKKLKGKIADLINNNYLLGIVITLIISSISILLRFWV